MAFFFASLAFMYVGRKLGWALSRAALYQTPFPVCLALCVVWGSIVAAGMWGLIGWLQPGAILRWIMGYALGSYVAIPNFGLVNESTVPNFAQAQHLAISNLPLVVYMVSMVALVYGMPYLLG